MLMFCVLHVCDYRTYGDERTQKRGIDHLLDVQEWKGKSVVSGTGRLKRLDKRLSKREISR